jgi:hypothetical protein
LSCEGVASTEPPLLAQVACRLYQGCGFYQHSVESRYAAASELGKLVLLKADAGGDLG